MLIGGSFISLLPTSFACPEPGMNFIALESVSPQGLHMGTLKVLPPSETLSVTGDKALSHVTEFQASHWKREHVLPLGISFLT